MPDDSFPAGAAAPSPASPPPEGPAALRAIQSWHAHIYYDPARTRATAQWLRDRIGERFRVQLGRWHDVLVGPHTAAMYQVAFEPAEFERLVPWLALNRRGLSVLVHPNTGRARDDHLVHALWLGPPLALLGDRLPEAQDDDSPVLPNTTPDRPA